VNVFWLIEAATQFISPLGMEGWVDFGGWLYTKMVYLFAFDGLPIQARLQPANHPIGPGVEPVPSSFYV